MTNVNAAIDDLMKALFGANPNCGTPNNSLSSLQSVEHPIELNRRGVKRRHPSSHTEDEDSDSLPSLELEDVDDISEPDSLVGDPRHENSEAEAAAVTDINNNTLVERCNIFEERETKRRRKNVAESSDLIVVLDMDECLIHSQMQGDPKENEGVQQQFLACDSSEEEEGDGTKRNKEPTVLKVNEHKIILRPGLVEFLKFVTKRFQTHIYTAGVKNYANPILDRLSLLIGTKDAFCKRWYRDDCETIDILDPTTAYCIESIYVKPLSKVAQWAGRNPQDLRRIVHIDDQPRNFLLNHGNGIQVTEWRGDNPNDKVLSHVTKMLERIDSESFGDVRPHLRTQSYLALKDYLEMMHLFPHRRSIGITSAHLKSLAN